MKGFFLPELVRCPLCGESMRHEGGSLYCNGAKRHTYDIAKEGYVNLLPPGRAKNARTGDGADMIRARERFLSGGAYDRYSTEAASLAAEVMTSLSDKAVMIDAGCGDGRHTANMAGVLRERLGVPIIACGFDASKHGAMAAAKKYVRHGSAEGVSCFFAAANIFSMPAADGCADLFCSLFAPLPDFEARRVLRSGGVLLICAAGEGHLHELRELLYNTPIPSGGGAAVPQGFDTVGTAVSEYKAELGSNEEIMSLFTMTPFYHNAPAEGRERLSKKERLTVTVQVKCTAAVRL